MIKWYQYVLKEKFNLKSYFSHFDTKLNYTNFKKKNWMVQLKKSFKANKNYETKEKFFKEYYNKDFYLYVKYIKKNLNKKKKILSIGSGRGVSELKLHELGYNITLSDLNYPEGLKTIKKKFKKVNFIKFNIFKNNIKKKYDIIICFNLIYAFDKKTLNKFFQKCRKILNQDGIILISPGSSTLNIYKIIYDKFYLVFETYVLFILSFFKKKKYEILKFQHGYIYSDEEIINIAKINNIIHCKKIFRGDFISEFNRSIIISKLILKFKLFEKLFLLIGKKMPFVNIFYFKKI